MPRVPVAERREQLVGAALEVIATHGIDGATTRRIAEQADANVAMVHYCYDAKEDLFADVFSYVAGRLCEVIESNARPSVEDTARHVLRGVMECFRDSDTFTAATLELINWARRQHGEGGIAVYDQSLAALHDVLRLAASDASPTEDDVSELALVISMLSDGFALNWLTYGDRADATRLMQIAESVLESWLSMNLNAPAALR